MLTGLIVRTQLFAIKSLKPKHDPYALLAFRQEVSLLQELQHGNIVSFHEVINLSATSHIVMEYCPGGDLRHVLLDHIDAGYVCVIQ
jgi:serine/threonine protein kinase